MNRKELGHWLGRYFDEYLIRQRRVSRHTLHSYRDSWKLLLQYLHQTTLLPIDHMKISDVTEERVTEFLDWLVNEKNCTISTRNVRLAGIRAFFRWLEMAEPLHIGVASHVLAIPAAKQPKAVIPYLERDELEAIMQTIPTKTLLGKRDYALLAMMYNTGARVQEIIDLAVGDIQMERPSTVRLRGKGDKERICVLWDETVSWLRNWIEYRDDSPNSASPVFVNRLGNRITRHGVRNLLLKAWQRALPSCPTLKEKKLHPHIIRHTSAMHMLQSGVDLITIQHILGHSHPATTEVYAKADLRMKAEALEKCSPITSSPEEAQWKKNDELLSFLQKL